MLTSTLLSDFDIETYLFKVAFVASVGDFEIVQFIDQK